MKPIYDMTKTELAVYILECHPELKDKQYRVYCKKKEQIQKIAYRCYKEVNDGTSRTINK